MSKAINSTTLQQAIDARGWTRSKLAEEIGVSAQSVTNWMQGDGFPRPATLLKLATLLRLNFAQLVQSNEQDRPIVAFRKKANTKTTDLHISRAEDIGLLLKPLVPYLPTMQTLRTLITSPTIEYIKLQIAVLQTRTHLGLGEQAVLHYEHLIGEFAHCGAVLVPVLLGSKGNHENAMHIRLPAEDVTFIFLNLDTQIEDFTFWMAHELAHVYTPNLAGTNEGEDYADAFAGALLFPRACAEIAYIEAKQARHKTAEMDVLLRYAEQHGISLNTVFLQVNAFAQHTQQAALRVEEKAIHQHRNIFSGKFVSHELFDPMPPSPKQFIANAQNTFRSPIYQALKSRIKDQGIEAGYLQQILNLSIADARALHEELSL